MKTTDLFAINRTPKRLNETLEKVFGKKISFDKFTVEQLEDARNKLRTQVSQVRSNSGFNENLENDAFTQAQWMLDAINAELLHRATVSESPLAMMGGDVEADDGHNDPDPNEYGHEGEMAQGELTTAEEAAEELKSILDADEDIPEWVQSKITKAVDYLDTARDYMHSQHEKGVEPTEEQLQTENNNQGEGMTKLREGEIQQASAIVTAKTMVDRIGRWIEELSGMENETLLQLGDQVRDEMGQEAAKAFISTCAPAIQQALENLKQTRDTVSSGVRSLASGEAPADMLGAEPEGGMGDEFGPAEPDMMNGGGDEMGDIGDEFGAAEPAAGGLEAAGREQRESIQRESIARQNNILRVLAG